MKGQSALNRYLNNHKFMSRISGVPFLPKSFAVSQLRKRNKSLNEKVRLCRQKYSTYTADSETPPPPLDFVGLYTFITVDYILNKAEGISFIHKIFL